MILKRKFTERSTKSSLMRIDKITIVFILCLIGFNSFSQIEKKSCVVVTTGYGDSYKAAYGSAVNQGLFDLILKCGSGINIGSTTYTSKTSNSESSSQERYRSLILGLEGLVSRFEATELSHSISEDDRFFTVKMKCRGLVYASDKSGESSFIEVYGLNSVYKHGEDQLNFEVYSGIRSYIYVYELIGNKVNLIYPDPDYDDIDFVVKAHEKVKFPPIGSGWVFDAKIQEESSRREIQDLVFVGANKPLSTDHIETVDELIELYSSYNGKKDIKIIKAVIER